MLDPHAFEAIPFTYKNPPSLNMEGIKQQKVFSLLTAPGSFTPELGPQSLSLSFFSRPCHQYFWDSCASS